MPPVLLVARREYLAYVTAWGFWVSLLTAPLLMAALVFAPILLARAEPSRAIAIIAERASDAERVAAAFAAEATTGGASPRYVVVAPPAPDITGLRPYLSGARPLSDGAILFAALNLRRDAAGAPMIEYWSANLQSGDAAEIARRALKLEMQREALMAQGLEATEVERFNALQPSLEQFDARAGASGAAVTARERAPFYAAVAFSLLLWTVVFSVANMLLSSVLEEKSNKILDTLLTSVTPLELLAGKLIGVAAVSATLFAFWGLLGGGLAGAAAQQMGASPLGAALAAVSEPGLLAAFMLGFVAGYLMYGAIFLALGALCDTTQEAQTLLGPVAIVLMLPMLLIGPALDNPNAPLIEAASWFPLFTPFLLVMRAPAGLSTAEIVGMSALMGVTLILILMLATRVFRAGVVNQLNVAGLLRALRRR